MSGSIRKLARLILAGMGDDKGMRERVEGLVRFAIDERIREVLDAAEESSSLEEAIDAEVDRRIGELGREDRLRARDDHHGHCHQVVLLKGIS
jgi:hypothetical protein